MDFLGHIITPDGLKPNPEKVKAVKSFKPPANQDDLRAFLGLVNYYRSFIPHMAERQHPLNKLLGKGTKYNWSPQCQEAFEYLRDALSDDCLRFYPDMNQGFLLHTDASDYAIGGVLVQVDPETGLERPVEYFSRSLTASEYNYSVFEKECLAIVASIKRWKTFLVNPFVIHTDHKALQAVLALKEPNQRVRRWVALLQEHDFITVYKKGKLNADADAVSRLPSDNVQRQDTPLGRIISREGTLLDDCRYDPQSDFDLFHTIKQADGSTRVSLINALSQWLETSPPKRYTGKIYNAKTPGGNIRCSIDSIYFHQRSDLQSATIERTPLVAALSYDENPDEWIITDSAQEGPFRVSKTVSESITNLHNGLERQKTVIADNPDAGYLCNLWEQRPALQAEEEYKYNLIGHHFKDSDEDRVYLITDIYFRDDTMQWVCTRRPVDNEPITDEPDADFVLEYVYRELAAHPTVQECTPRINQDHFRSQAFRDQVDVELPTMIKNRSLRQEDIERIPDEAGNYTIYRRQINNNMEEILQLIIPEDPILKTLILNSAHETLGHSKVFKMEKYISTKAWWPHLRQDIEEFNRAFPQCQTVGTVNDRRESAYPILRHPEVWRPWQRISIDYTPVIESQVRNKHIISVVDHFTKMVVARAVQDATAEQTADFLLEEIFFKFGIPDVIVVDNGSGVMDNQLNEHINSAMGSHISKTSSYHPCANGQVERLNKVLKDGIAKSLQSKDHQNWDRHLPAIVHAYNIGVNSTTGYSPFFLNYGRECTTPLDCTLPDPPSFTGPLTQQERYHSYIVEMQNRLRQGQRVARRNIDYAQSLYNKPKVVHQLHRSFTPEEQGNNTIRSIK